MKPTEILSLGFTSADLMPEGRIKGTLAIAEDCKKRRRERLEVCMGGSIAIATPRGSTF
jgi:hypothetical protein